MVPFLVPGDALAFYRLIASSVQSHEMTDVIRPISQMSKLRLRDLKKPPRATELEFEPRKVWMQSFYV